MSLRTRLFLIFSTLVLLLVAVQWWWVRALARDLSSEVGEVAARVGDSVAAAVLDGSLEPCEGEDCDEMVVRRRVIHHAGEEGGACKVDTRTVLIRKETTDEIDFERAGEPVLKWVERDGESVEVVGGAIGTVDETGGAAPPSGIKRKIKVEILPDGSLHEEQRLVLRLPEGAAEPHWIREIEIPDRGVRARLERFQRRLLLGSSTLFGLGLVLAALLAHRVSAPLRRLSLAAHEVGEGALGKQVEAGAADRDVGRAIVAFNRMSERLETLERRNRALADRQHLSEIGDIGRGLAHSLRNPLNALGLSLDELAAGAPDDDRAAALVAGARRQIRRIDDSVRSFLALASEGGAGGPVVPEPVDVAGLAREVALAALQDSARRVQVRVETPSEGGENGDPPPLEAVEPELRAVLQALVVNAVEASGDGDEVTIAVRPLETGRAGVMVEVADRGPGLPSAVRERLFTPHVSTKATGSGMGLFLAHRIAVTRYAGSLELRDREGGGTRALLLLLPRSGEGEGG